MTTTTTRRAGSSTTLAQIVAIAGGVKTRTEKALTTAYHSIQRPTPFAGIAKSYRPRDEEGEQLPSEGTLVQVRAPELIEDVAQAFARMVDVVATQDLANTKAFGDIVVDGETILAGVPVTHLMWLEKQVVLLRSFVAKLPVLDVAEEWHYDPDARAWANVPVETTRTKKVPRNHVKAPATDKHPAQVEMFTEDVVVGYWTTIKFSGALPASHVFGLSEKVEKLLDAIRFAREQANMLTVTDVPAGAPLVRYLFGEHA